MTDFYICGFSIKFGVSLKKVIKTQPMSASQFSTLTTLFQYEKYFIMPHVKKNKLYVTFRQNFKENDVLKAYFHASLIAVCLVYLQHQRRLHVLSRHRKNSPVYRLQNILNSSESVANNHKENDIVMQAYVTCEDFVDKEFIAFCMACKEQGWNTEKHLINIDDWRGDWPYEEGKREKVIKLEKSHRVTSAKPPPRSPPPQPPSHRPSRQQSANPEKATPNKNMNVLVIS